MLKGRLLGFARRPNFVTFAIGTVIGFAVCAPLIGGRRVFLLDWSLGPHTALANPSFLGLNGGLTSGVFSTELATLLNDAIGGASTWIFLLIFFPTATVGAGRLVGGATWTRIASGVLYAVNPFVFNRIFVGHIPLLIGYALLPFATKVIFRSISSPISQWAVAALWWAGLTALSPHFVWIFGLVILSVALVTFFSKEEPLGRIAGWLATSVTLFLFMSTYVLLPHSATNLPSQVGRLSLELYRTTSDIHLGLFANVLGLYGFWRLGPGPVLPKEIISGWPFLLFTILIVACVGAWFIFRSVRDKTASRENGRIIERREETVGRFQIPIEPDLASEVVTGEAEVRRIAYLLIMIGVCGFFLALGDQGPTGSIFLFAYDHVPFFAIMREPEKFLMLLALAYAFFFGLGVGFISTLKFFKSKAGNFAVVAVIGVILPLAYTANIFYGLNGQISPSTVPTAYQQADDKMGTGAGSVLYLPWHLYMSYPFTNNRVIANIGATEFRRSVISGDNVEAGNVESQSTSPRSTYLEKLFVDGPTIREFGALVAPLGVEYVVLAKSVDWENYTWLNYQRDLTRIINTSSLEVWRNIDYAGVGWASSRLESVSGVGGLLSLSRFDGLVGSALITKSDNANFSKARSVSRIRKERTSEILPWSVHELSPIAFRIRPGVHGWATVDAPFQRGWYFHGHEAIMSAEGTLLIRVKGGGGVLEFTPWRLVRLGYIVSILSFIILLAMTILGKMFSGKTSETTD